MQKANELQERLTLLEQQEKEAKEAAGEAEKELEQAQKAATPEDIPKGIELDDLLAALDAAETAQVH